MNTHMKMNMKMKKHPESIFRVLFRSAGANTPARLTVLGLAAMVVLAGCGRKSAGGPPGAGAPRVVGYVTLAPSSVSLTRELPGRTSAFRVAEVRARVDGIVLKRLFTEGAEVKEGQPLYQIDPAP